MAKWVVLICLAALGTALAAGLKGLPSSLNGFSGWAKVAQNLTTDGPHAGKNKVVFANAIAAKAWKGTRALPVGSIVVKTAGAVSSPDFVAVMEKTKEGGWQYEEFMAKNGTYSMAMGGTMCSSCHAKAKGKDYLFSR